MPNARTQVEIRGDGSAARDGQVRVGDQLIAVSGIVYGKEADYGGGSTQAHLGLALLH